MRFGLVGTGHWARITHAPALASTPGVEFAAVWGRDREAAELIAAEHGVQALLDFDEFIEAVDALSFAVPPDVQSALAIRAARAGKHLLLEKPIATSEADADRLVAAVAESGVSSVVFFTARFQSEVRRWLADVERRGGWLGGSAIWLGTALVEGSPWNTPWRREKGGLWDLGPHLVSLLWAALGPVMTVTADAGPADVVHLVLHHESGASSTVTVTASASDAAGWHDLFVWGETGRSSAPTETAEPVRALRVALGELADNGRARRPGHACDVRFGRAVGAILAEAERLIQSG